MNGCESSNLARTPYVSPRVDERIDNAVSGDHVNVPGQNKIDKSDDTVYPTVAIT